jgi:hypothetical protein
VQAGRAALGVLALLAAASLAAAQEPRSSDDRSSARASPTQSSPSESGNPKPAQDGAGEPAEDSAPKAAEDGAAQKSRLVSILGREVTNRDGDGGRVIDVLIDLDGRSGAVVVEFGGFMGIGSRKVAVRWDALRFVREGNRSLLIIDVSREQIKDAPEYKPNEPPTVLSTK